MLLNIIKYNVYICGSIYMYMYIETLKVLTTLYIEQDSEDDL